MSAVAIVAAHGTFAEGLRSAVDQITGRGALLDVLSNARLCAPDIEQAIRDRLAATGAYVVFTDLPAGSCALASRRLLRDRPDVTVVTGVNLATLLDFVLAVDPATPITPEVAHAAAVRAVERAAVTLLPPPPAPNAPAGAPRAG